MSNSKTTKNKKPTVSKTVKTKPANAKSAKSKSAKTKSAQAKPVKTKPAKAKLAKLSKASKSSKAASLKTSASKSGGKVPISLVSGPEYEKDLRKIYGDAFSEDPAFLWVFSSKVREKFLRLCKIFYYVPLKFNNLYVSGKTPNGFAAWVPPSKGLAYADLIKFGFLGALFHAGCSDTWRLLRAFLYNEFTKTKLMPKDSWYLFMLAIDENYRNQKIGEKLLRPVLDQADKNKQHCYTESSNERNITFYKRMGFEVARETTIANIKGAPKLFFLLRKPQKK